MNCNEKQLVYINKQTNNFLVKQIIFDKDGNRLDPLNFPIRFVYRDFGGTVRYEAYYDIETGIHHNTMVVGGDFYVVFDNPQFTTGQLTRDIITYRQIEGSPVVTTNVETRKSSLYITNDSTCRCGTYNEQGYCCVDAEEEYIAGCVNVIDTIVHTADSPTVTLTGDGTASNPLMAEATISFADIEGQPKDNEALKEVLDNIDTALGKKSDKTELNKYLLISSLATALSDSTVTAPTAKILSQVNEEIHKGGIDIIKKTFKDNKSSYTSSNTSFAVDADGIATLDRINPSNSSYIGIDPRPLNLSIASGAMVTVSAIVKASKPIGVKAKFLIDNPYGNRTSDEFAITDEWTKISFYYNFGTSDKSNRIYISGDNDGIIYIKEGIRLYVGKLDSSLEDIDEIKEHLDEISEALNSKANKYDTTTFTNGVTSSVPLSFDNKRQYAACAESSGNITLAFPAEIPDKNTELLLIVNAGARTTNTNIVIPTADITRDNAVYEMVNKTDSSSTPLVANGSVELHLLIQETQRVKNSKPVFEIRIAAL
ncbi:hypothetical protein D0T49_04320 [Paludibacter sp. 221]|uniref:hypothetical protein n=1 Tax=Paludibacter sp. 221 TaxID=2302939 RepID=UPI0013D7B8E4|nr:hypothetical protein [Paludibacter sp. 221]NDV46265.1 hypothetical protein [Paludibacter sp. 221]